MTTRRPSGHPFAVTALLIVAAVVGAFAIAAIWANDQLLDTRGWTRVSDDLLESPRVRHRLAVFLAEELVDEAERQLDAAGEEDLAAELVPQLRRRGPELAERVMATPRFRVVWVRANRLGHRALLRVLDEEAGTGEGGVVVDLTPSLRELADSVSRTELAESLDLPDLGSFVEPGAARIEVLEAEELDQAQDAVRAIRSLPVPATIATVALLALALLLGRARPSRTCFGIGLSLAAAGGLALLARDRAGHEIVDALLGGTADREAAEAAWAIATSAAVDLAVGAICLGGLIALFAVLAGDSPPRQGAAPRPHAAPHSDRRGPGARRRRSALPPAARLGPDRGAGDAARRPPLRRRARRRRAGADAPDGERLAPRRRGCVRSRGGRRRARAPRGRARGRGGRRHGGR